jgi:hypothetical protein
VNVKKPLVVRGVGWFAVLCFLGIVGIGVAWVSSPAERGLVILLPFLLPAFGFSSLVWFVATVFLWGLARNAAEQAKAMSAYRGPSPVQAREFHLDERSEFEVVICSRCNGTGKELVKKQRRQQTSPLDLGNTGSDK